MPLAAILLNFLRDFLEKQKQEEQEEQEGQEEPETVKIQPE